MKHRHDPPWAPVTVERHGKTYQGLYYIDGGKVSVSHGPHYNAARLGNCRAEALAKILLWEIVSASEESP